MSRKIISLAVALLLPMLAVAEEPASSGNPLDALPGSFSGSIGVASDYSFRGISQTREKPALQGNLDFTFDQGLTIGAWASNVDFGAGDDADIEIDYYALYDFNLSDTYSSQVGVYYYTYPGVDSDLDYDYYEFYGAVSRDIADAAVTASVNYAPHNFGDSGYAVYPRLAAEYPLPYDLTLSGAYGYQFFSDNARRAYPNYADWALGVGYTLEGFDLALQYTDTNLDKQACPDDCDGRVIFSVSRAF